MHVPRILPILRRNTAGTAAIETALITPILVLLSVGAFQVSMLVARQSELQSVAGEAAGIVLAARPETQAEIAAIAEVVARTAGLAQGEVSITRVIRCGTRERMVSAAAVCVPDEEVSTFLRIEVRDRIVPQWTRIGIGHPIDYRVVRTVQLS